MLPVRTGATFNTAPKSGAAALSSVSRNRLSPVGPSKPTRTEAVPRAEPSSRMIAKTPNRKEASRSVADTLADPSNTTSSTNKPFTSA